MATGADSDQDTAGGAHGAKAHHDRPDLGHAQSAGYVGLKIRFNTL